jgi:hypothetical protein
LSLATDRGIGNPQNGGGFWREWPSVFHLTNRCSGQGKEPASIK